MRSKFLIIVMILSTVLAFSQTSFQSKSDLQSFMQRRPTFKSIESGIMVTLNYSSSQGYFIELSSGKKLPIVDVSLNPSQPQMAILGIKWMSEPAPLFIDLRNNNKTLILPAIPGEENLSYDSNGYLRAGRTGRTNWMRLTMGGEGVQFTPYPANKKPDPEYFLFVEYKN